VIKNEPADVTTSKPTSDTVTALVTLIEPEITTCVDVTFTTARDDKTAANDVYVDTRACIVADGVCEPEPITIDKVGATESVVGIATNDPAVVVPDNPENPPTSARNSFSALLKKISGCFSILETTLPSLSIIVKHTETCGV